MIIFSLCDDMFLCMCFVSDTFFNFNEIIIAVHALYYNDNNNSINNINQINNNHVQQQQQRN